MAEQRQTEGFREAMTEGILAGYPVTNINIVDVNHNSYTCRVHIPIDLSKNNYAIYNGELLENIDTKNLYSFFLRRL